MAIATYTVVVCSTGGAKAAEVVPAGVSRPTCPTENLSFQTITIEDSAAAYNEQAQLALIGVNAPDIAAAFAVGFGIYVAFWALGFAAEAALRAIKMA